MNWQSMSTAPQDGVTPIIILFKGPLQECICLWDTVNDLGVNPIPLCWSPMPSADSIPSFIK